MRRTLMIAMAATVLPAIAATPSPEWLPAALEKAHTAFSRHDAAVQQVQEDLAALGVSLPADSAPVSEEAPSGQDSVATCEQGLFFDAADSRLIYMGNVKLRDPRLLVQAEHQLHICLTEMLLEDNEKRTDAALDDANQARGPRRTQKVPRDEQREQAPPPLPALQGEPVQVSAWDAVVDVRNNSILLYSPAGGKGVRLSHGDNRLLIETDATHPARLLADEAGNILLEGARIHMQFATRQGTGTLETTKQAYYHSEEAMLVLPHAAMLVAPEGRVSCTESLSLSLLREEESRPKAQVFLGQFSGMRFQGINTARASGGVVAELAATAKRPATQARGEELMYDGRTGAAALTGEQCELVYGKSRILANEGLHLLPNGDLELRGNDIRGSYERPAASGKGEAICGTFQAGGNVIFRAGTGIVTADSGLQASDAEGSFSCTGPAELLLLPHPEKKLRPRKAGEPNLAIASYGGVHRVKASGAVKIQRYVPGSDTPEAHIQAEVLQADLETGQFSLLGTADAPVVADFESNHLEAHPLPTGPASLQLLPNGDMLLQGSRILATMQQDGTATTAACEEFIRLTRAENLLKTGSSARLTGKQGIFTTQGPLRAILSTDATKKPRTGRLAHLSFHYNGIRELSTERGGTVQTPQGSMQCDGPVHVLMAPEKKGELGGLLRATASGKVAIAGRDSTGRMLRATGDELVVDAETGEKVLSGTRVTLGDAFNTHIASGVGAAVRIDARNNARITGSRHSTAATKIHEQIDRQQKMKADKK